LNARVNCSQRQIHGGLRSAKEKVDKDINKLLHVVSVDRFCK